MSHVVILSEVIIISVNDASGVHTGDVIPVAVNLNETMESNVEESKEVGHTNERLEINPKDKAE
jgi:hypothetical protein